jgi:hypothetical protein
MCSILVVVANPVIQISLQFLQRGVQLVPEGHPVKLIQNRFVEALVDAVCLRVKRLGFGVINVVERQVQLVIMRLRFAAVFGSSIGENSDH